MTVDIRIGLGVDHLVVFVDELPRNATGKVLKRTLVEREDSR